MPSTTINSLPPEVFGLIFAEVYEAQCTNIGPPYPVPLALDSTDASSDSDGSEVASECESDDEALEKLSSAVTARSFFPYGLASVCPYWENILSSVPHYWSTLVVFLNHGLFATEKCERHLSWSGDLPIDVFMVRDPRLTDNFFIGPMAEDTALPLCMTTLMPHIHRCRSLYINVTMNSSFPVLPSHVPRHAGLLQIVKFTTEMGTLVWREEKQEHTFHMNLWDFDRCYSAEPLVEFRPPLKVLEIDGRNLELAFKEDRPWLHSLQSLERLKIAFYQPRNVTFEETADNSSDFHQCEECGLFGHDVLAWITSSTSLAELSFRAVNFNITSRTKPSPAMHDLSAIPRIIFSDMQAESVEEIVRIGVFSDDEDHQTVIFGRCSRLSEVHFPPLRLSMACLQLWQLGDEVDLEKILRQWEGRFLVIGDCSNFSDRVIEMLCTPDVSRSNTESHVAGNLTIFPCNKMHVLNLHFEDVEVAPYSIAALRKLVEARGDDVDYDEEGWDEDREWGPELHTIRLSGKVPELSDEDKEWFEYRLVEFVVTTLLN